VLRSLPQRSTSSPPSGTCQCLCLPDHDDGHAEALGSTVPSFAGLGISAIGVGPHPLGVRLAPAACLPRRGWILPACASANGFPLLGDRAPMCPAIGIFVLYRGRWRPSSFLRPFITELAPRRFSCRGPTLLWPSDTRQRCLAAGWPRSTAVWNARRQAAPGPLSGNRPPMEASWPGLGDRFPATAPARCARGPRLDATNPFRTDESRLPSEFRLWGVDRAIAPLTNTPCGKERQLRGEPPGQCRRTTPCLVEGAVRGDHVGRLLDWAWRGGSRREPSCIVARRLHTVAGGSDKSLPHRMLVGLRGLAARRPPRTVTAHRCGLPPLRANCAADLVAGDREECSRLFLEVTVAFLCGRFFASTAPRGARTRPTWFRSGRHSCWLCLWPLAAFLPPAALRPAPLVAGVSWASSCQSGPSRCCLLRPPLAAGPGADVRLLDNPRPAWVRLAEVRMLSGAYRRRLTAIAVPFISGPWCDPRLRASIGRRPCGDRDALSQF